MPAQSMSAPKLMARMAGQRKPFLSEAFSKSRMRVAVSGSIRRASTQRSRSFSQAMDSPVADYAPTVGKGKSFE